MSEIRLQFFDHLLSVRTDVPDVEEVCRALFRRFEVREGTPRSILEIVSAGEGGWRVRDALLEAVIDRRSWLPGLVAARVLETAGNEVTDHDLFHAAAVTCDGHGLVIAGESGFGKSSLTVGLLSRGWRFLSDEVAAVHGMQPLLAPFPKAIEMRPQAAELLGSNLAGPVRRNGKMVFDPEAFFPDCVSPGSPIAAIVLLEAQEPGRADARKESLEIVVHRQDDRVTEDLQTLPGVSRVAWAGLKEGYPVLSLSFAAGRSSAWRIDEVLGRHGVLVLGSSAEETPPADFSKDPRLEPIPIHEGVARLLPRFRGRRALAKRIGTHAAGFGGVYLSLLERLKGVRFYRLGVGRMQAVLDLLEGAVR